MHAAAEAERMARHWLAFFADEALKGLAEVHRVALQAEWDSKVAVDEPGANR
jgi:hypothetical protein